MALLVLALSALRLIHLDADTPLDMTRNVESGLLSVGLYVDEGYKTLDARNLYLYGAPRWNGQDEFPGWMKHSPLLQWAYLASFKLFGQSLSSARIVTIAAFLVLLVGYAFGTTGKYGPGLCVTGLVLLGLIHHLFLFSRTALHVVPIATCVYCLLFFMGREGAAGRMAVVVVALVAVSSLATFGIIPSSPLYFFPVLAGLVFVVLGDRRRPRPRTVAIVVVMLLMAIVSLAATHDIWWSRIRNLTPAVIFPSILDNGLSPSSGFLVCLGLLCAFHALLTRSQPILAHPYGASLVAIVVLGPLLVSFFPYNPLRYYVPLLPAFLLLPLEWFHRRAWREAIPARSDWLTRGACLAVLVLALLNLARALNHQVLSILPLGPGTEPGLSAASIYRFVLPLAALAAAGLWAVRRRLFAGGAMLGAVVVLLVLATARDVYVVGRFLRSPTYQARAISADIRRLVPAGASIGGDWAPFFTLGSGIKAIYVNERYNRGERFRAVRPDYYLYCDTGRGDEVRQEIMRLDGVTLGPALYRARYAERDLILYPLDYGNRTSVSAPQLGDLVVAPADRRAGDGPEREAVQESDDAPQKRDPVSQEELVEQLQVGADHVVAIGVGVPPLQKEPVGGDEDDEPEDDAEGEAHQFRIEAQGRTEQPFLFRPDLIDHPPVPPATTSERSYVGQEIADRVRLAPPLDAVQIEPDGQVPDVGDEPPEDEAPEKAVHRPDDRALIADRESDEVLPQQLQPRSDRLAALEQQPQRHQKDVA